MKDSVLIAGTALMFLFGWFLMKRMDRFLDENQKRIKESSEQQQAEPCVHLVGKPFKETVDMVLEMTGAKREAMSFVGDRIYTDVKTGVVNGAHGILVLTGETKLEDVPKADVVPDAIFTGLKEMGEILKTMREEEA